MRRIETSMSFVHAGRVAQSSGMSSANSSSPCGSIGVERVVHAVLVKTSRLRAFQYSGSVETTRMTSLPSRGQVIGP